MTRPTRSRRGALLMETVLWVPILILLFLGTVELARVSYTYYTLKKILYDLARSSGSLRAINFCDQSDLNLLTAKSIAVTGTPDGAGPALLPNLEASQINVRIERFSYDTGEIVECACEASAMGCDIAQGARSPDFIVVTIPDGYPITLRFPGLASDPIPLKPMVRIPYGGL